MQRHQLGQALIGVACALFLGGAVALVAGFVGAGAVVPVGVAALGCLGLGGILAMPQ